MVWKVTVWVSQAAGSCKRPFLSNVNAARPTLLQGQEGICLWGLKVPWKQVIQFACKNLVLIASCLTEDQIEFLCNSGCVRENVRSLQEVSFCVAVDTVTWILWDGSSRPLWFYMRDGLFLGKAQGLVRSSRFRSRFLVREDWNLMLCIWDRLDVYKSGQHHMKNDMHFLWFIGFKCIDKLNILTHLFVFRYLLCKIQQCHFYLK